VIDNPPDSLASGEIVRIGGAAAYRASSAQEG